MVFIVQAAGLKRAMAFVNHSDRRLRPAASDGCDRLLRCCRIADAHHAHSTVLGVTGQPLREGLGGNDLNRQSPAIGRDGRIAAFAQAGIDPDEGRFHHLSAGYRGATLSMVTSGPRA